MNDPRIVGFISLKHDKAPFSTLQEEELETKRFCDAIIGRLDYEQTLQEEAEQAHYNDIEITDAEAPTINQLEALLNPNPDHKDIIELNNWAQAEHQANVNGEVGDTRGD